MESASTTRTRRRRTITLILATALIVAPASAFATGGFSDVETSDFFSDAVGWMKDNKVTAGCNPPSNTRYCPDDFVTRGQMAVFMERLDSENVFLRPGEINTDGADAETLDGKDSTEFLGKTEQAADADKLDGLDSTSFAPAASVLDRTFVTSDNEVGIVAESTTSDELSTVVTVPSGLEGFFIVTVSGGIDSCAATTCRVDPTIDGTKVVSAELMQVAEAGDGLGTFTVTVKTAILTAGSYTLGGRYEATSGGSFNPDYGILVAEFVATS